MAKDTYGSKLEQVFPVAFLAEDQGMCDLSASSISEGFNNSLKDKGARTSDLVRSVDIAAQYIDEKIAEFTNEVILLFAYLHIKCP